jgi:hypothetical protein
MSYVRKMIVWASGLIEFIGVVTAPDGAIVSCTIEHPHDFEELLRIVQEQAILHDFGGVVGLRVPGIDPMRPDFDGGIDFTVDVLIRWEDDIRDQLRDAGKIKWTRA